MQTYWNQREQFSTQNSKEPNLSLFLSLSRNRFSFLLLLSKLVHSKCFRRDKKNVHAVLKSPDPGCWLYWPQITLPGADNVLPVSTVVSSPALYHLPCVALEWIFILISCLIAQFSIHLLVESLCQTTMCFFIILLHWQNCLNKQLSIIQSHFHTSNANFGPWSYIKILILIVCKYFYHRSVEIHQLRSFCKFK